MDAPRPRSLDAAVVAFAARLRAEGLEPPAGHALVALRALEAVDVADREETRLALRAVFPSRPEELPIFDRAFDRFWAARPPRMPAVNEVPLPPDRRDPPVARTDGARAEPRVLAGLAPLAETLREWAEGEAAEDDDARLDTAALSDIEVVAEKDFSTFTPDELPAIRRLTRRLARRLAGRLGRRRVAGRRGAVDLRRTLRRNLGKGEVIELAYRRRAPRPPRLVVLCDVSGSMDLYSRFLVQFLHALAGAFAGLEVFTFSTRLTRVTPCLRARSFAQSLAALATVTDWSGGTRIGECIDRFVREWGRRHLGRRTVVIILSDGWDTGDPDLLAGALSAIRRRGSRLVWLNPLLGQPDYAPETRGMAAALPLVHAFLPAHNLASLARLERALRI
ncbi:MAG TPA: VWA domain-containing protein [Thermodesulfobacteriota bacterium]